MAQKESSERFWGNFHGPNMGYIEEQYETYKEDTNAVDPSLKEIFDQHGAPVWLNQTRTEGSGQSDAQNANQNDMKKLTSALKLVEAIRRYGHLEADIYPVGRDKFRNSNLTDAKTYGLTDKDLEAIPAPLVWEDPPNKVKNALDVVNLLKQNYSGTISFEYDHVNHDDERQWLHEKIDSGSFAVNLDVEQKIKLLSRIVEVEGFENFLAKTFVGQKRFSIEGLEMMIPMLDKAVQNSFKDKTEQILMGMAHRGRLSVLAHVLGKPIDKIFSEFHPSSDKELIPSPGSKSITYGWTGDVKYHFGASASLGENEISPTTITLAHNPSHLEFVNPVVEGFTRAAQDDRSNPGYPEQHQDRAFSILIHGDAAFIGEGIVAETLNLSDLNGYRTGGTLHIIANNLIGFTTNQDEGRSTRYASDLAKGFEIPIIHVNADDPEACMSAMVLAYEYRQKFHKDFLIDLVGYRRYGHNEMDEPRATQPHLYKEIDKHDTAATVYAKRLQAEGTIEEADFSNMKKDVEQKLRDIYNTMVENQTDEQEPAPAPKALLNGLSNIETAVPLDSLRALNQGLLNRPEGFNGFKKLEKILQKRGKALDDGNKADWATAEALAFASILQDGIPIRFTGQDSERGTFAHRHIVLHDVETGEKYCPMHGLEQANASFAIHNSPLSEAGVLGFEYGYSIEAPKALVLWEAQFGDFANSAQVIFDQFIAAGRAKWGEKSNMVMLLPHGYEGQGPEHSSARLERFLTLAAENNWIVANVTSAAQYFHLLRRQAALTDREESRPLIVMTPKSLLRNQRVASDATEFSEGKFQTIRTQPGLPKTSKKAKRIVIGSGKIMVDIEEAMDKSEVTFDWLNIIRLEQIYPFPEKEIAKVLKGCPNVEEIIWVQEEPRNMGSWNFVKEPLYHLVEGTNIELHYTGRPDRSSPAVGEPIVHKTEQQRIVNEVLTPSKGGDSREGN
ncbi:2-oxoglutarate dehydrogenase E1 component [Aquibacillus sp. 3ASR75-11]|uniref:2-oxoglutarate dehydrogenase E1 component n=1 Tax=Terrihalobacillus insolitus TaxID=2950438 RepID=A0A9X3WWI6_9BACI|nr:2-oxoglutarate dehydrogenase E1 component [Terrihalobacillus insolitus]MDC3413619.1 2-oxoglutarate dehydrogenase E1 component [Terrihalobacillus insolitus]MDC3424624.1 2-oxoglutarate dehydrogenase E1 component [Terrihalobacillus insolitus]